MRGTGNAITTLATGAALAAALCLAGCGGTARQAGDTSAPAESTTQGSSVEKYGLSSAWVGMGDDTMTYYYEGADQTTDAVLIYHTDDNTYERWVGPMTRADEDVRTITDALYVAVFEER